MIADLRRLTKALSFAAEAHRNQRRKGAAQEPYINHLIEVLDLVVHTTSDADMDTLIAALLHDVMEDTPTDYEDVATNFGERVAEDRAGELRRYVPSEGRTAASAYRRHGTQVEGSPYRQNGGRYLQLARHSRVPTGWLVRGPQTRISRRLPTTGQRGERYGGVDRAHLRRDGSRCRARDSRRRSVSHR